MVRKSKGQRNAKEVDEQADRRPSGRGKEDRGATLRDGFGANTEAWLDSTILEPQSSQSVRLTAAFASLLAAVEGM